MRHCLAQDVAAAARANRDSHNNAASVKAESEWYSPTRASIRDQEQAATATILYEISGNQDPKITMDAIEKGKICKRRVDEKNGIDKSGYEDREIEKGGSVFSTSR
jgi:hypothetical protein